MKSKTIRGPQRKVIDNPVQGPVSLASGSNTTYLVYQLTTGEIYVTTSNASFSFPARQSLVSGQASLPAAAPASGPAIAFDPVGARVIVAYLSADGTGVVVASSDPQLATGWTVVAGVPLVGNPLMPGLAMISGSFGGQSITTLYAAASSGKIIWASSFQWSNGFQSVTFQGMPLNPPSASGVSANLLPSSNQIVLGFALPGQSQALLFTSAPDAIGNFNSSSTIPLQTRLTPAVTIEPDDGAWNVFVNAAQTVYYITHYNGQWQQPQPLDEMELSMAGPPAAAWNGLILYVACTDRAQNLSYDMIALGTSKSGVRKLKRIDPGKRPGACGPVEASKKRGKSL